ncbi:cysteine peptidase family C39 domain-containing protein, partial [Brevundimonas sp.]|uniref:cysteine peptidase family C39 domain-containing protein n=1 Tax=Brevundimonas sp. TaxID=1871086 RepID=UPI0028A08801
MEQDTGLACLTLLLGFHQIPADQSQLRHDLGHAAPADDADLVRLAKRVGAKAKTATLDVAALENSPLPAIVRDRQGLYFLVGAFRDDQVLIQRPTEAPTALTLEAFQQLWSGKAVFITTRVAGAASAKFDVTWFIPALVKYRWMLGDVLAASLALQLFALATPMIFQVVIDKVLVHQGLTTLDVLAIGLITVVVFESFLGGLRAYVFSHTTSRVDVELGAKLYRHLLNLPLAHFESRRV